LKPYEKSSASTSELATRQAWIAGAEVADAAQSGYKERWIKFNTTPLAAAPYVDGNEERT
jgi:hypothetical protein